MTGTAELNATARVRQLIDLTERLTASLAGTQDLANAYRRESAQVKANPAVLGAAPVSERKALIKATQAFEAVLSRHSRAIEAARIISEGLVKTIAAEVAAQRGSPSAYGASGRANAGDGRAVAFNRTA